MLLQVLILVLSIVALYYGAEFALEAAEKIGRFFGLSPLVIGLLLIGFGTSLPEFFVSQLACFKGESGIALGNIIGSNIANLFLIMGVCGFMSPLQIGRSEIVGQLYIHFLLTLTLFLVLYFVGVNPMSVLIFGGFFSVYLWHTFREMKKSRKLKSLEDLDEEDEEKIESLEVMIYVKLIFGFSLLFLGGEFLVRSGSGIGNILGVDPYIISAIFVAFGTSFPELVTSFIAAKKGKNTDLITGNIIGSNIFNVAFVLGSIGFYPIRLTSQFIPELSSLFFASIFLIFIAKTVKRFTKLSGFVFLSIYAGMVWYWV